MNETIKENIEKILEYSIVDKTSIIEVENEPYLSANAKSDNDLSKNVLTKVFEKLVEENYNILFYDSEIKDVFSLPTLLNIFYTEEIKDGKKIKLIDNINDFLVDKIFKTLKNLYDTKKNLKILSILIYTNPGVLDTISVEYTVNYDMEKLLDIVAPATKNIANKYDAMFISLNENVPSCDNIKLKLSELLDKLIKVHINSDISYVQNTQIPYYIQLPYLPVYIKSLLRFINKGGVPEKLILDCPFAIEHISKIDLFSNLTPREISELNNILMSGYSLNNGSEVKKKIEEIYADVICNKLVELANDNKSIYINSIDISPLNPSGDHIYLFIKYSHYKDLEDAGDNINDDVKEYYNGIKATDLIPLNNSTFDEQTTNKK